MTLKDRVNPKGRELSGFSFSFLAQFLVFWQLQESFIAFSRLQESFIAFSRLRESFLAFFVITRKFGLPLVGKIFI